MSVKIGSLRVDIGLNSAKFSRGLSQAEKRLQSAARRFKAFSAGAVAAGVGLAAIARKAGDAIDAQAKLAQSLGTTSKSIQVLKRAGELSGVSMSEVEAGAMRLTRRLSMFIEKGGGPAAKAIGKLGLNARELMGLPLDQRIAAVSSAIEQNADASKRASLYSQLFGDRAFAAFSRLDAATIRQATDEIERMGLGISEIDAKKVEVANDKISNLSLVASAAGQKIATSMLPVMGSMADAMARAFEVSKPLRAIFDGLIANVQRLSSYIVALGGYLGGRLVAAFIVAKGGALSLAGALTAARVALTRLLVVSGIGLLVVAVGELLYRFFTLVKAVGGVGKAFSLLKAVASEAFSRLTNLFWAAVADFTAFEARVSAGAKTLSANMLDAIAGGINKIVGLFEGAGIAIGEVFKAIPNVAGEAVYKAANWVAGGISKMIDSAIKGINGLIEKLPEKLRSGLGLSKMGLLGDSLSVETPAEFKGSTANLGGKIKGAFASTSGKKYVESRYSDDLRASADKDSANAEFYGGMSDMFRGFASRPMESVAKLKEAMRGAKKEADDLDLSAKNLNTTLDEGGDGKGGGGKGLSGAAKKAGGALKKLGEKAKKAAEEGVKALKELGNKIASGIGDAVAGAIVDGQNLRENLANVFKGIARDFISSGIKQIFKNLFSGEKSGGGGLLSWLFGSFSGAHDKGGNIGSRQWGIVGERGPEIVRGPAHVTSRVDTARILNGAARARPAPQGLDIKVGVSADGNGNLMPFVESVAERKAVAASQAMGRQIDQSLPSRVRQIKADPRRI